MRQTQNREHKGKETSPHFNGLNIQGLIADLSPRQADSPKLPWSAGGGRLDAPPV